jgi:hypothetical protein
MESTIQLKEVQVYVEFANFFEGSEEITAKLFNSLPI